jgi:hypothetical protein
MSSARNHLAHQDDRSPAGASVRARDRAPDPAVSRPGDPRLAHGNPAAGLLHLQRAAGNTAVNALVAPVVQRVVAIDEVTAEVGSATEPGADAGAVPEAEAGPVTSSGGATTVSGSTIRLDAPLTSTDGVIRASTLIADNVVASTYTPGAGNVW